MRPGTRFPLLALALASTAVPVTLSAAATKRKFDTTLLRPRSAAQGEAATGSAPPSGSTKPHDAVVALTNERGFACSGVLVHPRAVLTARHCLGATRAVFGAKADELRAERTVVSASGVANRALDLALLVLETEAPVAPYRVTDSDAVPGGVRVVGFGCLDAECRGGSGRRTYFDAGLRPGDWGCSRVESARSGCIPEFELVLSRAQGADTCVGDSGGAVLEKRGDDWMVVAITSRSVADSVLRCGDGGIYVRAALHREWLRKELGEL